MRYYPVVSFTFNRSSPQGVCPPCRHGRVHYLLYRIVCLCITVCADIMALRSVSSSVQVIDCYLSLPLTASYYFGTCGSWAPEWCVTLAGRGRSTGTCGSRALGRSTGTCGSRALGNPESGNGNSGVSSCTVVATVQYNLISSRVYCCCALCSTHGVKCQRPWASFRFMRSQRVSVCLMSSSRILFYESVCVTH
jgi:hypothetical protein